MNGLGPEGACAMGRALCTNDTLHLLDISANRIPTTGALVIATALEQNNNLKILKVCTVSEVNFIREGNSIHFWIMSNSVSVNNFPIYFLLVLMKHVLNILFFVVVFFWGDYFIKPDVNMNLLKYSVCLFYLLNCLVLLALIT